MKKTKKTHQYTIRSVPSAVDRELRRRARSEGKSLNQAALDALLRGAGIQPEPIFHTDLNGIIGTWESDPEFDRAIAEQDVVDPKLWQ